MVEKVDLAPHSPLHHPQLAGPYPEARGTGDGDVELGATSAQLQLRRQLCYLGILGRTRTTGQRVVRGWWRRKRKRRERSAPRE